MRGVVLVLASIFLLACGPTAEPAQPAEIDAPIATPTQMLAPTSSLGADPSQPLAVAPAPPTVALTRQTEGSADSAASLPATPAPVPNTPIARSEDSGQAPPPNGAIVQEVQATGGPGDYTFRVTVLSPDTGCDEFAGWGARSATPGAKFGAVSTGKKPLAMAPRIASVP